MADFKIRGVVPPVVVPDTEDHELDVPSFERLINRMIGERLSISERTVETHRASIYRKLHIKTASELMTFCKRMQI